MKKYWVIGILIFLVYLFLYLWIIGQLIFLIHSFDLEILPSWNELLFKQRSPFLFESFGVLYLYKIAVFLSLNLLLGIILSFLVAANIVISVYSFIALRLKGLKGFGMLVGTIPALLSGAACCTPLLILLLGVQLSATILSVFAFLVPIAILLLLGSLWLGLRRITSGKF